MAQIFAPGVAQLRMVGTIGLNAQAQVLHFYGGTGAPWTQGSINTLATSAFTSIGAHLVGQFSTNVKWDYCEAIDLTDAVERVAKTTSAAHPGTVAPPVPVASASIMVSHHIGARYRGGHPRTYFPPLGGSASQDGDVWQAGAVAGFQTAYDTFRDDILAALTSSGVPGAVQCAPRYSFSYTADATKHKFLKERTGFIGPFPISASVVSNQVRTQRRRLGVWVASSYTTRIWAGQLAVNTPRNLGAVPAGKRLVVRNLYNQQAAGAGSYVAVRLAGPNTSYLRVPPSSGDSSSVWEGRVVFHELEQPQLLAQGAVANISVHGYLLDGSGGPFAVTLRAEEGQEPSQKPSASA